MGGRVKFGETFMKTLNAVGLMLLAVVVIAAVGGCKSIDSSRQGQATTKQDEAAKPLAIPKELTLDLGNKVTMKLVLIPAGKFTMGSSKAEQLKVAEEVERVLRLVDDPNTEIGNAFTIEGPQREVTISKPFYMGACEVTQEQYEQLMGKNPSEFKGAQNPVERVSWDDARAFCKTLSQKTGKTVCLPTEAQWEYACRAGTTTRFSFGDDTADLHKYGNYLDKSNTSGIAWRDSDHDDGFDKTAPAGSLKPNDWGLYGMHGNVWEWCSDRFEPFYTNAQNIDPTGPAVGDFRVVRGGSWQSGPASCRSADRLWDTPDDRINYGGFRVAVLTAGRGSPSTQPTTQSSTQPA